MNLGIVVNLVTFLILLYFTIQFLNTRKFIYKLPKMTREKYIALEILSKRVLISNVIMFLISIFMSSIVAKVVLMVIIGFTVSYALSELNILKEYVTRKKSRN